MNQINNNAINNVGSAKSSEVAGGPGLRSTLGLQALGSIVSGYTANQPSSSTNLAQATTVAAKLVG